MGSFSFDLNPRDRQTLFDHLRNGVHQLTQSTNRPSTSTESPQDHRASVNLVPSALTAVPFRSTTAGVKTVQERSEAVTLAATGMANGTVKLEVAFDDVRSYNINGVEAVSKIYD
jgi:hypothetical protein